ACLLLGGRADDQVAEAAHDVVALALELVGELPRLAVRLPLDPHLPGGVPPLELLLLPRLLRRLARPALLVVEPALDRRRAGLDALVCQLGLDDPPRLLGLRRRGGVDEELVPVARDREAPALELPGEALRLFAAEVEAEATEQRLHIALLGQLDSDAPVVAHVVGAASPTSARGRPNILSDLPVWSRNLVIPPSQKGQ